MLFASLCLEVSTIYIIISDVSIVKEAEQFIRVGML